MFGLFSSPKIILLLLVVGVVWWLVRRGASANRVNTGNSADNAARPRPRPGAAKPAEKARPIEDMVPCPKCGAYVAKNAGHDCTK